MAENERAATQGGAIAKQARKELESRTGRPVVSADNFLPPGKRSLPMPIKKAGKKK